MDNKSHSPPSFNIYHGSQLGLSHHDAVPVIHTEAAQWSRTAHAEKQECLNNGFNREVSEKVQDVSETDGSTLGTGV